MGEMNSAGWDSMGTQQNIEVETEDSTTSEFIFRWAADTDPSTVEALRVTLGATVVATTQTWGFELWETATPLDDATISAIIAADGYGAVADFLDYLHPNLTVTAAEIATDSSTLLSNDPSSDKLWGMNNTGQTGGTEDADIDALEAWDISRGTGVVVAVLDTGVDYTHQDLAANMWVNTGEIAGNGLDDDGNGFVDDIHGYDFAYNDSDPMDAYGHGTHVAGTIAAVADNGIGVVGVAPEAQIMALKFIDDSGSGRVFDAIQALEYAVMMGAQVSNNSWGGGGFSTALSEAISLAGAAGHTFVAAAGNSSNNIASIPHYPASFDAENLIAVAATNDDDGLAYFSNYGFTTVDVVAPGRSIYSTLPSDSYGTKSGTSMAAPHVTGIVALLLAQNPDLSPEEIRDLLVETSDPIAALASRSASSGRVNAANALAEGTTTTLSGQVLDDLGNEMVDWLVFLDLDQDGHRDMDEVATLTDADGRYNFTDLTDGVQYIAVQLAPGYTTADAPDPGGYRTSAAGAWTQIGSDGITLSLSDERRRTMDLPFEFNFFGVTYDQITITANGLISFDAIRQGASARGLDTAPLASIAPLWTDLSTTHGGVIRAEADTTAGTFTIQYDGVRSFSGEGIYTFETVLHADGDIEFLYQSMSDLPDAASIGLIAASGTRIEVSAEDVIPAGGIRFSTKPDTVIQFDQITEGPTEAPDITVSGAFLDHTEQSIAGTLWLDTDGDGLRDWGEAGIAGRRVYLDQNQNGIWDTDETHTTTGIGGAYDFANLLPGHYTIRQSAPEGWVNTVTGTADYALEGIHQNGLTVSDQTWFTPSDTEQTGTRIDGLGDDGAMTLNLPFLFPFFGTGYGQVTLSANGYLTFGGDGGASENQSLTSTCQPGPMIAALWDDLSADTATIIYHLDTEAERVIVQFTAMTQYDGTGRYDFQVILNGSGEINLIYGALSGTTTGATVGLSDGTGTGAMEILHDDFGLVDDIAFRFVPTAATDTGQKVTLGLGGTVTGVDLGTQTASDYTPLPDGDAAYASMLIADLALGAEPWRDAADML